MLNFQDKPGGIDWTTATFNPISGCLGNNGKLCPYCYILDMDKRFGTNNIKPAFHPERLNDIAKTKKLKPGDKIFVGSSAEMWGDWVKADDIQKVLNVCTNYPQYIFQFLTKNPKRYAEFEFPKNCLKGMTVDTNKRFLKYETDCLPISFCDVNFVSFEPLLEEISSHTLRVFEYFNIDWVIIGGESGGTKKPDEWADKIIEVANYAGIPVWVKENYKYGKIIKEWPIIKNN